MAFRLYLDCTADVDTHWHLTQPAVSMHVRQLEQRLGLSLLDRVGKRASPTRAGEVLLAHAARALGEHEAGVAMVQRLRGIVAGRVRIGTSASINIYLLPPILRSRNAVPLRSFLSKHEVSTVFELGWSTVSNGELLAEAERQFQLLITTDRNIRHQQNLAGRRLAVLVLPTTSWPRIQGHVAEIEHAIDVIKPGEYCAVRAQHALPVAQDGLCRWPAPGGFQAACGAAGSRCTRG